MTPKQLKDRFRIDMDDVPEHPDDTSGCLWFDEDILEYLNASQQTFAFRTRCLFRSMEVYVVAGESVIPLPSRLIDLRMAQITIDGVTSPIGQQTLEANVGEVNDYNVFVPAANSQRMRISLDHATGDLLMLPPPDADVQLTLHGFVEARVVPSFDEDRMDVRNDRHQRIILDGMKSLAYMKQDSETYNPRQAEVFEQRFYIGIEETYGEVIRLRREPRPIMYGGL